MVLREIRARMKRSQLKTLRRNKSLQEITQRDPGFGCEGKVGKFITAYLCAEDFATRLIEFYRADRRLKGKGLQVDVLVSAAKHFRISVNDSTLYELFRGGEGRRGVKSARQLRNGYLHTLSHEDRREILSSAENLISRLYQFMQNRISTM